MITPTETNQDYEKEDVFNPDVDIGYDNKTETDQIYVNKTSNGETKVIYSEVNNTVSTVIVTAAIMLLLFVIVIATFKYYSYQKEKDLIQVKIIHDK